MFEFVFHVHSFLRWIIVLLFIFALFKYLIGWIGKQRYGKFDETLMKIVRISFDIQVSLGIVVFIGMGVFFGFPFYHFKHAFFPLCGLLAIHSIHKWDELPSERRYRNSFFMILAICILVFIGIAVLPQGWTFEHMYRMN